MSLQENLQLAFPHASVQAEANDLSLSLNLDEVLSGLEKLKEKLGFIYLLDIVAIDLLDHSKQSATSKRFSVVYHLLHLEDHRRLRVRVALDDHEALPSIRTLWRSANWIEREIAEMFGLKFHNHNTKRLLIEEKFPGHPLRKDWSAPENYMPEQMAPLTFPWLAEVSDDERLCRRVIDIIPSHPAIQGTFMVRAEVLGDQIKRAKVEIGMQHRGVEKIAENKIFGQFIPYAERINFSSPSIGAIAWAKTVETALGIKLTDRAQALRMILLELSRVLDHATNLGSMAQDLRAWNATALFQDIRENVSQLFIAYTGSRLMNGFVRLGGLSQDLPVGWVTRCLSVIHKIDTTLDEVDKQLTQAPAWLVFHGEGTMSAAQAIDWGFSGPCLRACGVNYDLRKNSPYYFYQDVEFEVPLGINGDPYDRYLVRVQEMRQSLRIVSQVLDHIPSGSIHTDDPRLIRANSKMNLSSSEYAKHFDLYQNGPQLAAGEYYSFIESANGELGFYLVSDGQGKPYRLKIRGPSFYHFQSFTTSIENLSIDCASAVLASLNAVSGEIDR